MKKIYTIALAFAMFSTGSFAQSGAESKTAKQEEKSFITTNDAYPSIKKEKKQQKDLQVDIWTDDFSDPDTWVLGNDGICTLNWEIGVGLENQGTYPTGPILSTTADNGYAMLDSDYYGENNSDDEDAWFTNEIAIDLTDYENVILEFESLFRSYNNNACYVVISTTNTDWPDLFVGYDADADPNVWHMFPDVTTNESTTNPITSRINISDVAGGESEVWIRFNWTGVYGYSWFVDDVKVIELPDNDVRLDYGVISHNATGDEYGRVPVSQLMMKCILVPLLPMLDYLTKQMLFSTS